MKIGDIVWTETKDGAKRPARIIEISDDQTKLRIEFFEGRRKGRTLTIKRESVVEVQK